jgi:hypothetical protein
MAKVVPIFILYWWIESLLMVACFGFEFEFGSIPRLQIWLWLEVCREKGGDEGEIWAFRWQGDRDVGSGAPTLGWWF